MVLTLCHCFAFDQPSVRVARTNPAKYSDVVIVAYEPCNPEQNGFNSEVKRLISYTVQWKLLIMITSIGSY